MIAKTGVIPPHGWHLPVSNHGVTQVLRSETKSKLADVILRFRIDNALPIGDPEKEIDNYVCGHWPHFCSKSLFVQRKAPGTKEKPSGRRLIDRIRSWLANRYALGEELKFVTPDVAAARANICLRCKSNVEWRNHCVPCVSSVERNSVVISGNRKTPAHHKLKGCAAAGHENRVAVFLAESGLRHRVNFPNLPGICWMNKLTKETS